jgi:Holliday junction resolvase RusA-like endonuclease
VIKLVINMPLFSKSRPRVTTKGTFMPADYRKKQAEMIRQIKEQWDRPPLEGPIRLEIDVRGEGRADADNIVGALMDAANKLLWVDDRVSIIPEIQVRWQRAPKSDSLWVIRLIPLDCQETLL